MTLKKIKEFLEENTTLHWRKHKGRHLYKPLKSIKTDFRGKIQRCIVLETTLKKL